MELELQDNVKIMGLGKPTQILPTGWVYLQVTLHSMADAHVVCTCEACQMQPKECFCPFLFHVTQHTCKTSGQRCMIRHHNVLLLFACRAL